MFKSIVYHGNSPIGEVEIYPKDTDLITPVREIRISHLSYPSERCPPLAVVHTVGLAGLCFRMECKDESAPLISMHSACLRDRKTAIIPFGEEELHLVAMNSRKPLTNNTKFSNIAYFWGFRVLRGLYDSCLTMLNTRCLGIVFDLDETLIVANTTRSFEDRIDALQRKISNETDPQRIAGMLAEIKRYQEDRSILKQYAEGDQVCDNGRVYKVQSEVVPPLSDEHQPMTRPIIRLQERGIVLTRINPSIRDTSVLVRLRPAWEDLRNYLTARGRKRFEVYVCTMAERDYALEMWRLLDPDSNLINFSQLLDRIICVKAGLRKSLIGVFQDGTCHPSLSLVIDDRLKVWDEKDQFRVHVVPAFSPYYAPQAEANSTIPVLCVARNVACNVRGSFFKEFDEGLLPLISEVFYEDEFDDFPSAPDVGNYLISEDDNAPSNGNRDPLSFDGMADAEVERRLKEATYGSQAAHPLPTNFDPRVALPPNQYTAPPPLGGPHLSAPQPSLPPPPPPPPSISPQPSSSQVREEGEVPESELDPDTRRRLLILQHGQDSRDSTPPFPAGPSPPVPVSVPVPVPVPIPPMHMQMNRAPGPTPQQLPFPPNQNPRFHPQQLHLGEDRLRQSGSPNYRPFAGWSPAPNLNTPAGVLQDIAMKCGSKVEFRSVPCDSTELQFSIEVWLVGEKIGEGTGRTRREAQHHAAEISLRNLANKYLSGAPSDQDKPIHPKENGFVYNHFSIASTSDESRFTDQRNPNFRRAPASIASLKELCTMEGFNLVFQAPSLPPDGPGIHAQVEIAGQILGKGVGATWEEAKIQAADEALGTLKSMLGQFTHKRSGSPRSLAPASSKRLKPDFSRTLQRIPSSGR